MWCLMTTSCYSSVWFISLPFIYRLFTIYLPFIYRLFTVYLPFIYRLFTCYFRGPIPKANVVSYMEKYSKPSVSNWLHCKLPDIEIPSLIDHFHYVYTKSMKQFYLCVKSNLKKNRTMVTTIQRCLPQPVHDCLNSKRKVVKTIRLSMYNAEKLLNENPNLKVIHLVRDPRGMFASQFKTRLLKPTLFQAQFKEMCTRMTDDAQVTKRLIKGGNSNVKLLRYEDLASNPVKVVTELYKFIGEPFTEDVLKYVLENTSLNLKDNCMYCTRRGNSTLTANKWRRTINAVFLRMVNHFCGKVYSTYGYKLVESIKVLRNLNIPVVNEFIPLLT